MFINAPIYEKKRRRIFRDSASILFCVHAVTDFVRRFPQFPQDFAPPRDISTGRRSVGFVVFHRIRRRISSISPVLRQFHTQSTGVIHRCGEFPAVFPRNFRDYFTFSTAR